MTIDENTVGIWFVSVSDTQDWLGTLVDLGNGQLKIEYRHRYYDEKDPNNDAFSGKDRKSWYSAQTKMPREEAIEVMRLLVRVMPGKSYELLMGPDRNVDEFLERFKKMPFVHMKRVH